MSHKTENVYRLPWLLAVLSVVGLLSALFGDGLWDFASWVALSVPLYFLAARLAFQEKKED
jgi:hypothetical protein